MSGAVGTIGLGASMALSLVPSGLRRSGMTYATARWSTNGGAATWASEEWSRHDPSALIQAGLALSRFDSTGWLGQIDVPTAVVITEEETTVPTRRQHLLAESIPGATTFPVAGNHRACVDAPGRFVSALVSACDSVRSRSVASGAAKVPVVTATPKKSANA